MKQANIKCSRKLFFKHWLRLTRPFHKLTNKEIDVVALLLYYHDEYKNETKNKKMLWKYVFDYETKMLIKKELDNMKDQILQNILTSLRKKKVVINNKINPVYIPDIKKGTDNFKIIFNLIINAEGDKEKD